MKIFKKIVTLLLAMIIAAAFFISVTAYEDDYIDVYDLYHEYDTGVPYDTDISWDLYDDVDRLDLSGLLELFASLTESPEISAHYRPFTPDGQATVTDHVTEDDGKEFFTFTTPAGNVFFLIIDHQRDGNNVYFLNAVTEQSLIALAERAGTEISGSTGGIPVSSTPSLPDEQLPNAPMEEEPEQYPTEDSGGNGMLIFLVIAVAGAGGAGYYFKVVRPKQQASIDDDEDDDIPENDDSEEMQFMDEPPEQGDVDSDDYDEYFDVDDDDMEEDTELV